MDEAALVQTDLLVHDRGTRRVQWMASFAAVVEVAAAAVVPIVLAQASVAVGQTVVVAVVVAIAAAVAVTVADVGAVLDQTAVGLAAAADFGRLQNAALVGFECPLLGPDSALALAADVAEFVALAHWMAVACYHCCY